MTGRAPSSSDDVGVLRRALAWIVVAASAALIFWGSSQTWSPPSPKGTDVSPLYHAVEYGLLALLVRMALMASGTGRQRAGQLAIWTAVMYGLVDEIHQLWVPTREAAVIDVVFGGLGAWMAVRSVERLGSSLRGRFRRGR